MALERRLLNRSNETGVSLDRLRRRRVGAAAALAGKPFGSVQLASPIGHTNSRRLTTVFDEDVGAGPLANGMPDMQMKPLGQIAVPIVEGCDAVFIGERLDGSGPSRDAMTTVDALGRSLEAR